MESLSMKTLANSLPNSGNAASEKQLMDNFKAAALSITTLYRSSLDASKQAYSSGYVACLKDILQFVQAGVCTYDDTANNDNQGEHGMMTIGRVMDWVEARLEAIKSTNEEEEEERMNQESTHAASSAQRTKDDKEREKDARRRPQNPPQHSQVQVSVPSQNASFKSRRGPNKDGAADVLSHIQTSSPRPSHSLSPAPPNLASLTQPLTQGIVSSPSPPPSGTGLRSSTRSKRSAISPALSTIPIPYTNDTSMNIPQSGSGVVSPSFTFSSDVVTTLPQTAVAGTKRRHAAIMAAAAIANNVGISVDDGDNSSSSVNNSTMHPLASRASKRRGRGRTGDSNSNALQLQSNLESMDVEEDGRERKRVTRR